MISIFKVIFCITLLFVLFVFTLVLLRVCSCTKIAVFENILLGERLIKFSYFRLKFEFMKGVKHIYKT